MVTEPSRRSREWIMAKEDWAETVTPSHTGLIGKTDNPVQRKISCMGSPTDQAPVQSPLFLETGPSSPKKHGLHLPWELQLYERTFLDLSHSGVGGGYIHNHNEGDTEELPTKILGGLRGTGPVFRPYKSKEFPDHRVSDRYSGYPPCEQHYPIRRTFPSFHYPCQDFTLILA
jgi:hypothetical protein